MTNPQAMPDERPAAIALRCGAVQHVALCSGDLARAREFYVAALGLPLLMESADQFIVLAGQTSVGVHCTTSSSDQVYGPREKEHAGLLHLALGCESDAELARIAEELATRGVATTGVCIDDLFDRRYVRFRDPDGIHWEVCVT